METLVALLLGFGLLFVGRKLFWFFVGAAGFVAGWSLAQHYLPPDQGTLVLVSAIAAGIIGVLLALLLQKVAVLVGGFLAGGYALLMLSPQIPPLAAIHPAIPFVIGGILGAILVKVVFDVGVMILSSLAGAALISEALHLKDPLRIIVVIVMALVGVAVQWRSWRGSRRNKQGQESPKKV